MRGHFEVQQLSTATIGHLFARLGPHKSGAEDIEATMISRPQEVAKLRKAASLGESYNGYYWWDYVDAPYTLDYKDHWGVVFYPEVEPEMNELGEVGP